MGFWKDEKGSDHLKSSELARRGGKFDTGCLFYLVFLAFVLGGLYGLVRFVKWAWEN